MTHTKKGVANKAPKGDPSSTELNTAVAQRVFDWKQVQSNDGELIGKKQDKLGRWRTAKVSDYANDPVQPYAIDERMKQVGCSERYLKELSKITKVNKLPPEWATPEQRSKAAIKVLGSKVKASR
jgi:hypothetical protein